MLVHTRLNSHPVGSVREKQKRRGGDLILPVLVVRIPANTDGFIALLSRGSALGLDFRVTREVEWADCKQDSEKKGGGDDSSALKVVRPNGALP